MEKDRSKRNRDFIQLSRKHLMQLTELAGKNYMAFKVFMTIAKYMDGGNALCISMQGLLESLGVSLSTVNRAVKYLKEEGWVQVYKTGSSNVYVLNDHAVWTSYADERKYCMFDHSKIFITESENGDALANRKYKKLKHMDPLVLKELIDEKLIGDLPEIAEAAGQKGGQEDDQHMDD